MRLLEVILRDILSIELGVTKLYLCNIFTTYFNVDNSFLVQYLLRVYLDLIDTVEV